MIDLETCCHEAAHGLAAYLLGGKIRLVEVCEFTDSQIFFSQPGLFRYEMSPEHRLVKNALCATLVGPAASFKMMGATNIYLAEQDIFLAKFCLKIKGEDFETLADAAFYRKFCGDAEKFVNHEIRWKIIRALGEELQQRRRRMSGKEVVSFIQKEASKLSSGEQLEFFYPEDGLGGDQLPITEHKEG